MSAICRLCLRFSNEKMLDLCEGSEILCKVRSSLSLPIILEAGLPNAVCQTCYYKLECFKNFQIKVIETETLLLQYFKDSKLDLFLNNIKNGGAILDDNNVNNKENVIINKNNGNEKTDVLIKEENVIDGDAGDSHKEYSSDDIALASLRDIKKDVRGGTKKRNRKSNPEKFKSEETDNDKLYFPEGTPDSEKKWKCLTCFQVFDKRSNLRNHYKEKHYEVKTNFSSACNYYDIVTSDNGKKYKCKNCDKFFDSKRLVQRHSVSHKEDRPFICNVCGRTYKQLSEIIRHGRVHSGFKPLLCSYESCDFSTAYHGALRAHEGRHCPDTHKFTCEQCGKGFNVRTWYEQHQNYHSGQKPYVCDICGHAFYMAKYLKSHRNTCHPQASNQKRHVCMHCGLACDNRTVLNTHLKEHGLAKSYLCDICGRRLSSAEHLKLHRSMHLGEKPHSCSMCGKAFLKKSNLKIHLRVHSGERPYVCAHCGKGFSQKSPLVVHTRYHTGSRPYQCTLCPKAFVCRSRLSAHQKACL